MIILWLIDVWLAENRNNKVYPNWDEYDEDDDDQHDGDDGEEDYTGMIVGIIVGVVVLTAASVYFVCRQIRKKRAKWFGDSSLSVSPEQQELAVESQEGNKSK